MEKEKKIQVGSIIKVIVLVLVIAWIVLFFYDYFRARKGYMPAICLHEVTETYEDGTVEACTSLGYKMYKYNRSSIPITVQFGPFFIQERTS